MSDFWRVFLLLTAGGTIGGLLFWTSTYLSSINMPLGAPSNKWSPTALFCFANAFMGVGGAWAALLAMFWARRVPLGRTPTDLLELLATSIIAGYASNRIMPAVASGMTQQLLESATATAVSAAQSANRSRVLSEALAYLAPGASQTSNQTTHIIALLQAELKQSPESTESAILLARTLAERKKDSSSAINALKASTAANPSRTQSDDEAIATAFWNLAIYLEAEFQKTAQPQARQDAISALIEALRLAPSYRTNLAQEPALTGLRNDPSAKPLL